MPLTTTKRLPFLCIFPTPKQTLFSLFFSDPSTTRPPPPSSLFPYQKLTKQTTSTTKLHRKSHQTPNPISFFSDHTTSKTLLFLSRFCN
uniref:Uncharacterized protein n=1 Tax=Solanum lycopersicum TaxID=4081 RepID=A0A3Q7ITV5_SOLLC